jgi:hypothetical protein
MGLPIVCRIQYLGLLDRFVSGRHARACKLDQTTQNV